MLLASLLGGTADWLRYCKTTRVMKQKTPTTFNNQDLALLSDMARLSQRDQKQVRQLAGVMERPH